MPKPAPDVQQVPASDWRREASAEFAYLQRDFCPASGQVRLHYRLDGIALTESIQLPVNSTMNTALPAPALEAALDLLHWIAGISYWKAGCPKHIHFEQNSPDDWQAAWLTQLYREGLAEFAWHNGLDPATFPDFPGSGEFAGKPEIFGLKPAALVPMGGGKDSLVALERVRAAGVPCATVQVGESELIRRVAERCGAEHLVIERQLDSLLGQFNAAGAYNGHVPVTAINAAILIVAALFLDYGQVVFGNERSADDATLTDASGREINHQFSKSYAFERMLSDWVERYIGNDLAVFSVLRRDRELAVCREFARLSRYHDVFSSCNRNFHLDGPRTSRWCGQCPKCHFVFLALAPFLSPATLKAIFGRDLLDDRSQVDGFRALLGVNGAKPFECVGEIAETRAALGALTVSDAWRGHAVVRALAPLLEGLEVPSIDSLCRPDGPHRIPDELLAHT